MNRRVYIALILTLALWPPLAHASEIQLTQPLTGGPVREMDIATTGIVVVDSASHPLVYEWSMTLDETNGRAYFKSTLGNNAEIAFPWISAASAGQLNGMRVTVKVVVRHANPADEPVVGATNTVESSATFTITGVNHPPVPVVGGKLGTPTARLPTGSGVCANCYDATDPDGDTFRALWDFGPHTGGRWVTTLGNYPPTLFASEGGQTCFSVLDMSAPIDQEIMVRLEDGLHTVVGKAIIYLKPAGTPSTSTNRAPTVTFPTNPVVTTLGGTAQLVAEAEDLDGDALDYSYVFLQTSATVASSAMTIQTLSPTKKRVTASIPASQVGSFDFGFTAKEKTTTDRLSWTGIITLQITSGGTPPPSGGPGDVTDTPGDCGSEAGSSPTISITPNPTTTKPVFTSGNLASISVVAFDTSERPSPLNPVKTQKGATVTWVLTELTALGVNPTQVTTSRAADQRYTDSTVTFTVPTVSAAKDVYLTVIATDVFECTRTVRFAIRLTPSQTSNNQAPVAKIQYRMGAVGSYVNAPATPVTVETNSAATVSLKSDCTDDAGTAGLSYTWGKQDSITAGGVTLSSTTGSTTSLSVNAHSKGTLTVTLTAKDQGNLTGTAQISFNIVDPAQKPIARATVKVGGQALSGAVDAGKTVTLDGSASSRPDNSKNNLTYQWTQTEGPDVTINNADKPTATFLAPAATATDTRLKFKLIVTDDVTPSDPVEVTVNLSLPNLYFSQIAVGPLGTSEFRTVLLLVNRNNEPAHGVEVKFYGQDGHPMDVNINDVPWDDKPFDIATLGSKRLVFSGHDLKSGWAKVKADVKIAGLVLYQIVGKTNAVETEIGLYATEASTKFATFYDPEAENAIAVANPSSEPAEVRIRLMDDKTGKEVVSKLLFIKETGGVLQGMNHKAKFITPEFLGELPTSFTLGTMLIESDVPVSITVLKTRGGVVFSTLPVASMQ